MKDRFEIQGLVGEGGAGAVYKAYDTTLDRIVAIKRLRTSPIDGREISDISGSHATPEALLQEAKLLSALQHPNIVTVYDAGISDEEVFIVMEFLTGDTLCKVIENSVLPMGDFKKVATQTLEGLCAAHGRSMLHRDIKPANLMLVWDSSGDYRVKLLDFGLAKLSNVPVHQTIDHESSILGSIHFMAPEQFERAPLDSRSDLYSLGCVLYYSLTGHYPFQGETAPQVMASRLQAQKLPVGQFRNDIPEEIQVWLDTMMARYPDDRFASAKSALAAFQDATTAASPSIPTTGHQTESRATAETGPRVTLMAKVTSQQPSQSEGTKTTRWVGVACVAVLALCITLFLIRSKSGADESVQPPARTNVEPGGRITQEASSETKKQTVQKEQPELATEEVSTPEETTGPTNLVATSVQTPDKPAAVFDPFDTESIHRHLGERITVEGRLVRVVESKSGKTRYLNFSRTPGESISLNLLTRDVKVPVEELNKMAGRMIRGTGKVDDFNGLHVRIIHLNDLQVVD